MKELYNSRARALLNLYTPSDNKKVCKTDQAFFCWFYSVINVKQINHKIAGPKTD